MLVAGFPAGSFRTNCYVVAPAAGGPCVVVDPGQHAVDPLEETLARHRLTPVAVLLTHGHLDHTFSVAPVCDGHDIPAWIHPGDRELLADPAKGMSRQATAVFGGRIVFREPADVRELTDGAELDLAGLSVRVEHAPGHTPGSVVFSSATEDGVEIVFAGDTLFAGSIGRTDLPGGDMAAMRGSLRKVFLSRRDDTVVLPGHGAATTVGRERAANPYLQDLHEDDVPTDAPAVQLDRRIGL
ncbi:Glyoxylase, beta-lactamase superfamily II [Pseudonocardia thermophila]|uniref:Glyoxylase, beta-lactamase superfamily II n=1 Tax=Pseudonocardia thermophila TaxID=1848 RepID=A0A1M6Z5I0_PSETH|nr:MBL fold metallo-hydrolase [Pseudonocardia thermophila]SHL25693.1 Glyoxylase, beta-lactamase superfamily II [Pseudonocardia thermophila]